MEIAINKEQNKFLKKHVDLVLCANYMTLIQRKIFNILLYKAFPLLNKLSVFQIKITEIAKLIGYSSRNYVPLVTYINELVGSRMEWRIIDGKTKPEDIISASCAIITSIFIKDGYCIYKYNDDVKQQLHNPGIYAKIDIHIQALIKSSFGLVLYEVCEKYKNIGCTAWLEISKVRQLMGVQDTSYKLFADFEKYVLQRAVDEVNSKSNFLVLFEKKREKRSVKYIKFIIKMKQQVEIIVEEEKKLMHDNDNLLRYLIDTAGFKPENAAHDFIEQYGEKIINEQISIIKNTDLYKSGKIRNMAAIIRDAVNKEGGYQEVKSSRNIMLEAHNKKFKDAQEIQRKQKEQEHLNKAYSHYISEKVNIYLQEITEDEVSFIKSNFIAFCKAEKKEWIERKAISGDFTSPMVKYPFNKFVIDTELCGRIMTKEQFAKNG